MTATVGVAALLAGIAGVLLIGTHWYWAMVGAVAAVGGAHVTARLIRGTQRLVGTLVGVLIAAGLLALQLPPWAILVVAVAMQVGAELFVGRNYGIAMVFITPLALLMISLASPATPDMLLRDRVLETVIGVAVGTIVAIVSAALRRRSTA
nr:FUSC family protein [Microbacterium sp. TL13]